jgi:hypothetical protein
LLSKSQGAGALPADTLQWPNGVSAAEFITATANPATAGVVRLAKSDAIEFRNNANSGDLNGLSHNTDDTIQVGDTGGAKATTFIATTGAFSSPAGTAIVVQPLGTSGNAASFKASAGGTGGAVNITAGAGSAGNGGVATITGGASATSAIGGNVVLVPGTGTGSQGACVLNGTTTIAGKITSYNGLTGISGGVPVQVATIDLTGQSAALANQAIYTTSSAGFFRCSYVATVTQAATTSCVLGGATGFQLIYNDLDTGVPKNSNPTTVVSSAINTTSTSISGVLCGYVTSATGIQFSFGYTSVGGTAMNYNLHIRLEAL